MKNLQIRYPFLLLMSVILLACSDEADEPDNLVKPVLWSKSSLPSSADVTCIAINGNTIFVGTFGEGLFRSTDKGQSWKAVNTGLPNEMIMSIGISGNNIFVGTNGDGVFLSTNDGDTWTPANNG